MPLGLDRKSKLGNAVKDFCQLNHWLNTIHVIFRNVIQSQRDDKM